eukprot:10637473-Alexandrium_andersonii.AAC.1
MDDGGAEMIGDDSDMDDDGAADARPEDSQKFKDLESALETLEAIGETKGKGAASVRQRVEKMKEPR